MAVSESISKKTTEPEKPHTITTDQPEGEQDNKRLETNKIVHMEVDVQ